jgi:hypothetical protein
MSGAREVSTVQDGIAFVERHGIVLASAKGRAPRLTEAIVGEPIRGSWWGHPHSHRIYRILSHVMDSEDVLVCRLLDDRITLVHRRLWPALVKLHDRFAPDRLAQVRDEHTPSGRHVTTRVPFPDWVPAAVDAQAADMEARDAERLLAPWLL